MDSLERQDLEKFVYDTCNNSPAGADLLISAFIQSLRSNRRSSVCTPFPNALFWKTGDKDFRAVEAAVHHFPQIHKLSSFRKIEQYGGPTASNASSSSAEASNLAISLQVLPLQSLRLLSWLFRFRFRLMLVLNPVHELYTELPFLSCGRGEPRLRCLPDFVLRVEEEERGNNSSSVFDEVKSCFGSIMAFHGTSAENLHSILRCGLLNLSNTSLQRNGAIYGDGIYLSTDLAVALSFSKAGKGWQHSCFGERIKYVLLCEVAKGDGVLCSEHTRTSSANDTSHKALGTYVVVQNSDLVKIRYIFLYAESPVVGSSPINNIETSVGSCNPVKPAYLLYLKKVDWCKMIIIFYIGLLLGIAFLKSTGFKYGPRS